MNIVFTNVNLSSVDLNLLHVLHVVLEERSVTAAARRLHVTPPAVSNALRRLRDLLDDQLFVRSGRGLVPTPRAIELGPVVSRALADLEGVLQGDAFDPARSTRTFTITLSDADQLTTLPEVTCRFTERFPRAHLRVVSVDFMLASGGLAGAEIDLVIGPVVDGPGLRHEVLYEEEAVFVVRADHPRVRSRLSKTRFETERHVDTHIAQGRGGEGHRAAEDAFAEHGLTRDIAITVPTFVAAAWVAASTDLIAGVPRRLAESLCTTLPIRIVQAPLPMFRMPLAMSWHERTHADPAALAFREVVAATFA
jgi:DNA-binding transcriptional LysR family regulator